METSTRKPVAPFYAVAVLWVAYGLLVPLYAPLHYVLLAAASAVVFFAVNAICKNAGTVGGAPSPGSSFWGWRRWGPGRSASCAARSGRSIWPCGGTR